MCIFSNQVNFESSSQIEFVFLLGFDITGLIAQTNISRVNALKLGLTGENKAKSIFNPIKQVGTQVYRVSELLKKSNINIWVQGAVFFTNYQCEVELQSNKIPVFSIREEGENEILKYISSYENNNSKISIKTKEEIISILSKYCIRENGASNEVQSIDIFTTLGSN